MGRSGSSSRKKHSKRKSLKVSSEGHRRKKNRKNKSKKLRHHDDSFSSCSDDESTSSSLYSSSSSDSEYKSKRSRSRARNEIKGSKKRRRRSPSEDSSKDSSYVKKRKRSKRNKKIKKKKKPKKDAYIGSASDSESCSTCKDEDRSNDELGSHGRSRGRSREKKKDHKDSTKGRIGNKKNRSKSRSSSPSKLSNSYDNESIENVTIQNNPTRLKSVIIVANLENEEEDDMKKDELKEEIIYENDDYPSCKSNDSNELVDRFNISPEKKSVFKEVNSGSSLNDNKSKESNISSSIGLEVDNMESILRQKALENLSKFRGGIKTTSVVNVDDKHKGDPSGVKQLTREAVSMMTPVSLPVIDRSRFTWRRDPSVNTGKNEKAATYSGPHSSGSQPATPKSQSADLSSTSRVENKIMNEKPKIMVNTDNSSVHQKSTAVVETPSSASIKEQKTESNDNSQFEKKTMSVMRGGEMVQVSYKVYIPNRAPALARRQLKR